MIAIVQISFVIANMSVKLECLISDSYSYIHVYHPCISYMHAFINLVIKSAMYQFIPIVTVPCTNQPV